MSKLKKIYIEITNCCNFACSFCFPTRRKAEFISPENFALIAEKVRPFTDYVYLHVLGEPLLHPRFEEILRIANRFSLKVNITTNGALLEKQTPVLLAHSVRQINISLHDAEENIPAENWEKYWQSVADFTQKASNQTYINLRLWNSGVAESVAFNRFFLNKIADTFGKSADELERSAASIADRVFLQHAPRFEWADGKTLRTAGDKKTCYALRDQIAILVDGTVVPCCLDAEGAMPLGNVYQQNLGDILRTERAQSIKNGFENGKITENFCRSCGFLI